MGWNRNWLEIVCSRDLPTFHLQLRNRLDPGLSTYAAAQISCRSSKWLGWVSAAIERADVDFLARREVEEIVVDGCAEPSEGAACHASPPLKSSETPLG